MATTELHQAFLWTCDRCGRDNFERAIVMAPEEVDLDDLPEHFDVDSEAVKDWLEAGGEGRFVRAPKAVRCRDCGSEFEAEVP